jgi:hypothetical protein
MALTQQEQDYRLGAIATLYAQLPAHMGERLLREAAERPDEWPTITKDANEIYPTPDAWERRTRCYIPGVLHWQWADGSGFPPSEDDRARLARRDKELSDA